MSQLREGLFSTYSSPFQDYRMRRLDIEEIQWCTVQPALPVLHRALVLGYVNNLYGLPLCQVPHPGLIVFMVGWKESCMANNDNLWVRRCFCFVWIGAVSFTFLYKLVILSFFFKVCLLNKTKLGIWKILFPGLKYLLEYMGKILEFLGTGRSSFRS